MHRKIMLGTAFVSGLAVCYPYTTKSPDSVGSEYAILAEVASDVGVDHLPEPAGVERTLVLIESASGSNSSASPVSVSFPDL
jgi:hypothetical protein